jgi:hypothetical protein
MLRQAGVKAMTIRSDNASTVCNLQRQGAGLALLKLTRAIFKILTTLDIRLHVAHIPRKENALVDSLSRMEVTGDYALDAGVFQRAVQSLGVVPTVNLFAHKLNRKLVRFVVMGGPLAEGAMRTDAFSFTWKGELVHAFPPVQLVGRVPQRIQVVDNAPGAASAGGRVGVGGAGTASGLGHDRKPRDTEAASGALPDGVGKGGARSSYGGVVLQSIRGEQHEVGVRFLIEAAEHTNLEERGLEIWFKGMSKETITSRLHGWKMWE